MDTAPILTRIAELLNRHKLEAIMVGNAATMVDACFLFRKTPANIRKLKAISWDMQAVIMRPFHPAVDLFRMVRDNDLLQIDFIPSVAGAGSFEDMRKRASRADFGGYSLYVASPGDAVKRKRATAPPSLRELPLDKESEFPNRDRIRRWQALPPEKRTNFLRVQ